MPATAPEAHLLVALDHLNAGRADAALANLSLLTRQQPDFRLAQYLYASLLDARSGRPPLELSDAAGQTIASLSSEAQRRWAHRLGRGLQGLVPQSVLTLNDDGVLGVSIVADGTVKFVPIQIASDTRDGVWVGTGSTSVRLERIQPPGKKPMIAADWARGARLDESERAR